MLVRSWLILALCACAAQAPALAPAPAQGTFTDVFFATRFELRLAGRDPEALERGAQAAFAAGRRVEELASVWRPDSAVSRFNASAARAGRHAVPAELARIVARCLDFCAKSDDAFDPTVGALLALRGYYVGGGDAPSAAALAEARARVGCGVARVEGTAIVTEVAGVRLDLGGVAKGWAVDRMAEALRAAGIEDALISGGRSAVVAFGDDPQRGAHPAGWPFELDLGAEMETWWLTDEAVAISGQLSEPVFVDGKLVSHIVDPRTGVPVTHGTLSSVVRGRMATGADLASTAVLVLGSEGAARWLASAGVPEVAAAWAIDVDAADHSRRVVRRLR